MASLKELMITAQYMLATNTQPTIESALIEASNILIKSKNDIVHDEESAGPRYGGYNRYPRSRRRMYE